MEGQHPLQHRAQQRGFNALVALLAQAYGEELPETFHKTSGDQFREMCLSYMHQEPPAGKQVLVILEGLDETADWQSGPDLFPATIPAGIPQRSKHPHALYAGAVA